MLNLDEVFGFTSDPLQARQGGGRVARIPRQRPLGRTIFQLLERELSVPGGYHHGWDGLEGVLSDLSWIGDDRVTIVHEELPALDDGPLVRYLEALAVSTRRHAPGRLKVFFPTWARPRMEAALATRRAAWAVPSPAFAGAMD